MTLKTELSTLIKIKGYSRYEISKMLDVSLDTIHSWCSNRIVIPTKRAYELKEILGLDNIEDLIKEEL